MCMKVPSASPPFVSLRKTQVGYFLKSIYTVTLCFGFPFNWILDWINCFYLSCVVSDRCFRNEAVDESGPNLEKILKESYILPNSRIEARSCVPDEKDIIEVYVLYKVFINSLGWCRKTLTILI